MMKPSSLYNRIQSYCVHNQLLDSSSKPLVALSGGADSVCLLHYLVHEGFEVEAAHCNFHLRGTESLRDEQFVRNLCESMQVKLHVKDFDTRLYAQNHHISIEMAARDLRYEWFQQLLNITGCNCIAVAHHSDDNIESVLLNLIRGTGLKGLRGIQPKNGQIVRPLLCLSKQEILELLQETGQDYVDDSTNFESHCSRNILRLDVMPLLRNINPGVDNNILKTAENVSDAYGIYEEAIQQHIKECCETHDDTLYINKERLREQISPLSVLHHLMKPLGFNRSQLKQLLYQQAQGQWLHTNTHTALVDREAIIVKKKTVEDTQPIPIKDCRDIRVSYHPYTSDFVIKHNQNIAYLDADKIKGNLIVRTIKAGDSFHPFGMKGRKLVSDLLTDLKANRLEKQEQKVVCDDEHILWVIGRRAAEEGRITFDTVNVCRLELIKT